MHIAAQTLCGQPWRQRRLSFHLHLDRNVNNRAIVKPELLTLLDHLFCCGLVLMERPSASVSSEYDQLQNIDHQPVRLIDSSDSKSSVVRSRKGLTRHMAAFATITYSTRQFPSRVCLVELQYSRASSFTSRRPSSSTVLSMAL